ncbi:MAG: collagen-like protein [Methanobrevibacter sp.]|nr:collagen-like protein [Methanobrevibacter sp.]
MPLIFDGKTYRNLEEQVRKNMDDITSLQKIQTALNEFGIHVLGIVEDESQLPESSSEFGNAYAVGQEAPYEYYIWTDLDPTPAWMNIGVFPAPSTVEGPAGPQGTSVTAATIVDGFLVLTLTDADGNDTQLTVGYVRGNTGPQGPRGLQGIQGIQGEQGPRGYPGAQGPRGYTGFALDIIALLEDVAELPDPDTGDRHDAYVVQTGDDFELYGKVYDDVTDSFSWENFGLIAFSTNYVTAAELQAKLDDELEAFVDEIDVSVNTLVFYNNYSGNEVADIPFAKINGQNIVGVNTNFDFNSLYAFKSELNAVDNKIIVTEPGKKYKIVACVLRNYNGIWEQIDGNHSPINISSISQTSGNIEINYSFTAKNVVSFVACPDEDFSRIGYEIGASVGLNKAVISVYHHVNYAGYIAYSNGSFSCLGDITNATIDASGEIAITHKNSGTAFGRSVLQRNGDYLVTIGTATSTTDYIKLRDYSGNVITTPDNNFRIYWSANGVYQVVPEDADQNGNIWCFGIFEID